MQKLLFIAGVALIVAALTWPWLAKLPIGRLPGDVVIDRPGMKVYFPFTSMLIVSAVISFLVWLFRK